MEDNDFNERLEQYKRDQQRKIGELKQLLPTVSSGVLLSLDYRKRLNPGKPKPKNFRDEDYFYDTKIVGQVDLTREQTRELLDRVLIGLEEESESWMCFNPRHGLQVMIENRTIEFLICFECGSLYIYDAEDVVDASTSGSAEFAFHQILIANNIKVVE